MGLAPPLLVELGPKRSVGGLQLEDRCDAGQIEPPVEQPGDLPNPLQIVGAAQPGSPGTPTGSQESSRLVQPQVLGRAAHQLGGDRDPVHARPGSTDPASSDFGLRISLRTRLTRHPL